jgi:hypothetical protein
MKRGSSHSPKTRPRRRAATAEADSDYEIYHGISRLGRIAKRGRTFHAISSDGKEIGEYAGLQAAKKGACRRISWRSALPGILPRIPQFSRYHEGQLIPQLRFKCCDAARVGWAPVADEPLFRHPGKSCRLIVELPVARAEILRVSGSLNSV